MLVEKAKTWRPSSQRPLFNTAAHRLCTWNHRIVKQNWIFLTWSVSANPKHSSCRARDHCSTQHCTSYEHETTGYLLGDVGRFSRRLCGTKNVFFYQMLRQNQNVTAAEWETTVQDSISTFVRNLWTSRCYYFQLQLWGGNQVRINTMC